MRALRFEKTGSVDELKLVDAPMPAPADGEVLVKVVAAAVNPSDVKSVLGKMHETKAPRIPGRDFAGVIAAGPPGTVGQAVFGTGGNLGFGRDGSHAEFVAVPQSAVLPKPERLSFEQAAAIGLAYMTAYDALVRAANLQAGETVLILGATGGVGGAAARIAHSLGARVLGTVRNAADIPPAGKSVVDAWIDLSATELDAGTRNATGGRGADVVLDVVGGPMFEKCLGALARRGRQVAISSGAIPRVSFNLVDFYHNESRLLGVDTLKLSFAEAGDILRSLLPGIERGDLPPPAVQTRPLERGAEAYREINDGTVKARIVLTTGSQ
jgi:NADPH2:quinone reductase